MEDNIAIKVDDVSKEFKLPHEKTTSLKSAVVGFYKRKRSFERQEAVKNVSFEVKKGDFFAIVGRNGSGKSTLLKMLAGIYTPSKGAIQVNGKLTPFIELGVGFSPELTGRENVYLNGALLGFSRKEMEAMYQDVVDFAELSRFMDQKLKNYSSGMQVRLAFSIAIRAKGDILLLDEVLAVGDAAFQQKCYDYFEQLKRNKQTVVFVSHDMGAVKRFCNRAILIEKGIVKAAGTPEDIAGQYTIDNITSVTDEGTDKQKLKNKGFQQEIKDLSAKRLSPINLQQNDSLKFMINYALNKDMEIILGYSIISNGFSVAEQNTKDVALSSQAEKQYAITCEVPLHNLNPGSYSVDVAIFEKQGFKFLGFQMGALRFVITGSDQLRGGAVRLETNWKVPHA